ncbi:bifunctional diguanylate cyclase/phosphodiesterase [Cellulomonas sp. KRMCY2]|uniref:putative bifunctional diguanylate cyclase/phosphodiesterase n=1 Tax=Cellulomonas sp. KRMCY2 TaxID=1304865 RepID=UPI0004B6AE08|nr:bifunctional diguanylate cyclase/phosphodiesterase [Cellulomonas sp. KRMCY2]
MKASWRRYLFLGVLAAAGCVALPLGVSRDVVYCLIGVSGAAAIMVGVRRYRPAHPVAWYLMAAGTVTWVAADGLYGWYEHVALIEPFPSPADALYLTAYPLFAGGLWVLVRSRGPARGSAVLLDTAILMVGLGLLSWVFLIEPTWTADGEPMLTRVVGVAYPLGDVLLFTMLVRLAMAERVWNSASRLVAGSFGALLVADSVFAAGVFVPAIAAHTHLLDLGWLVSYVLMGAAALHPSMRALSAPAPERAGRLSVPRMVALAAAVAVGPALLAGEVIAGVPPHNAAVLISSGLMVPLLVVRMVRIVRQLEHQADRLGLLADTDYGTGLANRRLFVDRLDGLLSDAHGQVAGFLLIDLERSSEINDTLGSRTSDAILHAVGVRLGELTGGGALVARMGSNTFGVLDPSITTGEQAYCEAVRIRMALELPLDLADLSVSVEVSVGALVLPEDGPETAVALLRADAALSAARARSDRSARYGIEMAKGGTLAPMVIAELREAIEHADLVVHYQPQLQIRSGRVFGVEALVRWQHPRHGLLGPDAFIPAAEHIGLIGPLTQYVLDSALHQCARWRREGLDLTVAVNLSVRNLLAPGLVGDVRAALARHGVEARSLELEITEGTAMVDLRRSMQVLSALSELGVMLSIDDYGTGHSSLAYLQRLPVRRLKIDRSFVTGMIDDDASAAIVRSTVELARVLRLDVVAEGVEDDATLLMLRDMRCFAAQGFGLGRPVPAPLVPELVARIQERLPAVLGTHVLNRGLSE